MTKKIISRRNAIATLTAGGFIAGAGLTSYASMLGACSKQLASLDTDNRDVLFAFIASPGEAQAIGQDYNKMLARRLDVQDIRHASPALDAAHRLSCKQSAMDSINQVFRTEFAKGDILVTRGWVLSKSETLICALWASFLDSPTSPMTA